MSTPAQTSTTKTIYVTRTGLPLSFKLEWPFRHATSGADFDVLHTVITLENSEGLRALVAVNLSATLREVLPSIEPKDTEALRHQCSAQGGRPQADGVREIRQAGAAAIVQPPLQLQTQTSGSSARLPTKKSPA